MWYGHEAYKFVNIYKAAFEDSKKTVIKVYFEKHGMVDGFNKIYEKLKNDLDKKWSEEEA